jgi:DNA-binding MurR/RpiR family transcriptional regulator
MKIFLQMRDLLDRISNQYHTLSSSQRKVAEYLFHNLNEAILLSCTQIAKKADVSEATVTRFVTNLGFSGLAEFKREIGQKLLEDFSTTRRLAESAESFEGNATIFREITEGDIENIRALTQEISDESFEEAVEKLRSARSIFVLGLRSSYALAFFLAFNLRFFLRSVKLITPGIGDIPEQIIGAGRDDVLVAISFKRYTRQVHEITEKIRKKGTYIIAITNSGLSPIAQAADMALIAETKIPTYIDSFTAPMSLINALITAIAIKEKEKALSALTELEAEFEEFATYMR